MRINTRLFQANFGIFAGIIAFFLAFFLSSVVSINPIILTFTVLACLYFYKVAFEYQRITLTIGRCLKAEETASSVFGVADVQMILSSSTFGFFLFLESIVFGLVLGHLFRLNIMYSGLLFLTKYIALDFIPMPIPYKFLFSIIDKKILLASKALMMLGSIESMVNLTMIYKKMPHDKTYEDWAFDKYGNDLLHQKL